MIERLGLSWIKKEMKTQGGDRLRVKSVIQGLHKKKRN